MSQSYHNRVALRELKELRRQESEDRAAREREADEERTRPLREAEQEFQNTFKEYVAVRRENLLKTADEEFVFDPDAPKWFATQAAASDYNKSQAALFIRENPEYYASPENVQTIAAYLEKNGHDAIVSAKVLQAAFTRLREFALLQDAKDALPQQEPVEALQPTPAHPSVAGVEPQIEQSEPGEWGYSELTGEKIFLSTYQISRLSGDQYKRFLRIPKNQLELRAFRR